MIPYAIIGTLGAVALLSQVLNKVSSPSYKIGNLTTDIVRLRNQIYSDSLKLSTSRGNEFNTLNKNIEANRRKLNELEARVAGQKTTIEVQPTNSNGNLIAGLVPLIGLGVASYTFSPAIQAYVNAQVQKLTSKK